MAQNEAVARSPYPHIQPFCVGPRRNLYKKRAWWQLGKKNVVK